MKRVANQRHAIGILGGTFDPIHAGHLLIAAAAARRFRLDRIYFIPSSRPPHKKPQELAPFPHRYAMVALACAGKDRFVPSLAEAPNDENKFQVFYSIDTVRRFREECPQNRIYFILGADSFMEIPIWRSYQALLDLCDFIIATRPGIRLDELRRVIPAHLLSHPQVTDGNTIALRRSTVHLMTRMASNVSSTDIRQRCKRGASIHTLVPRTVEDYIRKQVLYR